MRMNDPHISVKTDHNNILDETIHQLEFLKWEFAKLDSNLTDSEKSNPIVATKLTALKQKISQLEKAYELFKQHCNETSKENELPLESVDNID